MVDFLAVIGPTAAGKTRAAVETAFRIDGEIISADSRQVYQGLDIGSGKDLQEYSVRGKDIPYHLIDISPVEEEYNLFQFQRDFLRAYHEIKRKDRTPILCGGTGLYIEAVVKGYNLVPTPENKSLREELEGKSDGELVAMLSSYKKLHNKTDIEDRSRLIRALEIAVYEKAHPEHKFPNLSTIVFGLKFERNALKSRITERLRIRLENGMIDEVQSLLDRGVSKERLFKLGLEYRYVSMYLTKELNYNDMYQKLNSAIHAFAKRQMTWFRKMERDGICIHWIDAAQPVEAIAGEIVERYNDLSANSR